MPAVFEGGQAIGGSVHMEGDGVGDLLPGAPEIKGMMPRVSGGPVERVNGVALPITVWFW